MKQILIIALTTLFNISVYSQTFNGLDHPINVTNDINGDQYMGIKLFILKEGKIGPLNDVDTNVVYYSFDNIDAYVLPCNLDPMVQIDSIMPESNYCELMFKIKFDSPLYNSFFQYMTLRLVWNQVLLEPVLNDPEPQYTMKREDLINIVQSVFSQIINKE